jgi:hypothetical protein
MDNVTHIFILFYLYACHDNALYFEYFSFLLDGKKNFDGLKRGFLYFLTDVLQN